MCLIYCLPAFTCPAQMKAVSVFVEIHFAGCKINCSLSKPPWFLVMSSKLFIVFPILWANCKPDNIFQAIAQVICNMLNNTGPRTESSNTALGTFFNTNVKFWGMIVQPALHSHFDIFFIRISWDIWQMYNWNEGTLYPVII